VALAPDGKVLALGTDDQKVKLWDIAGHRNKAVLSGHRGNARFLRFSADGKTLVSGSGGGMVKWWEAATGKEQRTLANPKAANVALTADGGTLAWGQYDGKVELWDVSSGKRKATLGGHSTVVSALAFSPDGKALATGSGVLNKATNLYTAGEVKMWNVATGKELSTFQGHNWNISCLAFSPDGRTLATATLENVNQPGQAPEIKLWSVP
jgi:WD40 repeat protein